CYLFVAEPQPFGLAESACVLNKGHLVSVMNGFENAMLADGGWTSVSCSNPSPFICAIPEDAHPAYTCPTCATPTCPSPPPRPYYCESEWTYFEHTQSCYRRFFDATFDDAEEICVSEGGHLTSIWSSAENDFVVGTELCSINVHMSFLQMKRFHRYQE
ncbi:C-type lectin domain-containing protein, partial [Trichostrongylus colubriformis]